MNSLNDIKKELNNTENLKKIFSAIKMISKVNMQKYEELLDSTTVYKNNISLAFAGLNKTKKFVINNDILSKNQPDLLIVFGAIQNLCGKFNNKIFNFLQNNYDFNQNYKIISIGNRLSYLCKDHKINIYQELEVYDINSHLKYTNDLLSIIRNELKNKSIRSIFLYYMIRNNTLVKKQLLPISDDNFLQNQNSFKYPPLYQNNIKNIYSHVIKQYIFIEIYYALINSLFSEQINRYMTLQNSEDNLENLLHEIKLKYSQKRQEEITNDILAIIAQFLLRKKK